MDWFSDGVRYFLSNWGYCAIVVGILGENAGLPIPGEAILIAASFLAKKGRLELHWVIPVGITAAIVGQATGYWLGRTFGQTFLRWLRAIAHFDDTDMAAAKKLICRRGVTTIFVARFIVGLRTVAGVLAGTLGMERRRFCAANVLGAVAWVTTMSLMGYAFGARVNDFSHYVEYVSWTLGAALFAGGYLAWKRYKKSAEEEDEQNRAAA